MSIITRIRLKWLRTFALLYPDKLYLQRLFPLRTGYKLNLDNPSTFNEKLQWLKLYDRNPLYSRMVDKAEAKGYVAEVLGTDENIIPTLAVYDRAEDIDFDVLPNQFVLKCTHDSGGIVICRDKSKLDKAAAIEKLRKGLKTNYFYQNREWPYKNVRPRIIAERYIEPAPSVVDLPDYKWYCFDGEPKYCQVIQARSVEETIDLFDTEWNHQEFVGLNRKAGNAGTMPVRPAHLETHLRIARELSKGTPYSRIDLYETGEHTYFGEVTLYPASGMCEFRPDQYNELLGRMIHLPCERRGGVIITIKYDGDLEISQPDLRDYKFFCFNGEVKCFKIDFNRQTDHHANYYDREGHLMPFGEKNFLPEPDKIIDIPEDLDKLINLAESLSKGKDFVRVDLYNLHGKTFFGEITFYPASGMGRFEPEEWDATLGSWIQFSGELNEDE